MTARHAAAPRSIAWGDWSRLVIASVARIVVASLVGGLVWAILPMAVGWRPTTVMSDSMAPRFLTGDVAVSMPATPALETIGSILLVDDPDHPGRLRLHRMVDLTPDGQIVTKGDANRQADSSHIDPSAVRGVAFLRIPFVGLPLAWAKGGQWWLIGLAFLGFVVLVRLAGIDADLRALHFDDEQPASRRHRRRRRRRDRVIPPMVLAGSASAMAIVLALTTGAHAAFAKQQVNSSNSWTATTDFACWPTTAAADSPYFYYRFDRWPATTATDFSTTANPRPGTVGTGTTKVAGSCPNSVGAASPSLGVNGTSTGQVTQGTSSAAAPTANYSLEAWFQTSANTGKVIGFGNNQTGTSTQTDRQLYLTSDGKINFGAYNGAGTLKTIASSSAVNNGAWHHVVATFATSGSTIGMRLYVDGALVSSDTSVTSMRSVTGWWRIGYDSLSGWSNVASTTAGFNGSLDDVAVYTTTLTAAQVSSHYATGH